MFRISIGLVMVLTGAGLYKVTGKYPADWVIDTLIFGLYMGGCFMIAFPLARSIQAHHHHEDGP